MIMKRFGKVLYLRMVVSICCVIAVGVVVSALYFLIDFLFVITLAKLP